MTIAATVGEHPRTPTDSPQQATLGNGLRNELPPWLRREEAKLGDHNLAIAAAKFGCTRTRRRLQASEEALARPQPRKRDRELGSRSLLSPTVKVSLFHELVPNLEGPHSHYNCGAGCRRITGNHNLATKASAACSLSGNLHRAHVRRSPSRKMADP